MMKNIALNSVARVFVIVFQLINIKLYTNHLNADQLGVFFFLLAVSYSANALLFVPVDYFQQAKLSKVIADLGGARSLLNFNGKIISLYLCFSLLLIAVSAVIRPDYTAYAALVTMLALALYVVQALRNTLNNLGYGNHVSASFIQEAGIKVAVFYVFVDLVTPDATLLINAWLLSLLLTASYLMAIANKHRIFSGDGRVAISSKEVFHFSYPFSVGAVGNWLQLQGYRLVLVPLGYSEVVGVFATLSGIGSAAIGAISLIYSQQLTPKIYQSNGAYTATYLKGALAVTVAVAIVTFVLGEIAVGFLTSPSFELHWKLILFGVVTDAANLFVGALAIQLSLSGCTNRAITSSLLGLIAMLCIFSILYVSGAVSVNTVGIPLLISQWCVVAYLYWKFIKSPRLT